MFEMYMNIIILREKKMLQGYIGTGGGVQGAGAPLNSMHQFAIAGARQCTFKITFTYM